MDGRWGRRVGEGAWPAELGRGACITGLKTYGSSNFGSWMNEKTYGHRKELWSPVILQKQNIHIEEVFIIFPSF